MSKTTMIGRSRVHLPLLRLFSVVLIFSMLILPAGALAAPSSAAPLAAKAIFFASDGMRPDLMQKYVSQGVMPTYAD